jgi:hypothetical protein
MKVRPEVIGLLKAVTEANVRGMPIQTAVRGLTCHCASTDMTAIGVFVVDKSPQPNVKIRQFKVQLRCDECGDSIDTGQTYDAIG